jgi:hypothetical protein
MVTVDGTQPRTLTYKQLFETCDGARRNAKAIVESYLKLRRHFEKNRRSVIRRRSCTCRVLGLLGLIKLLLG